MDRCALLLLFLGALLIPLGSVNAENMNSGVAVYTSMDHGRDEIAVALPFVRAERHALLVNATTKDGDTLRITNNQLKKILLPTDLSRATVVDEAGIRRLKIEVEDIRSMQSRYPRAANELEPIVGGFERMIQAIEGGNVLVHGRLIPKTEYEKQLAAARGQSIDITLGGRSYTGAKLSSINGDKVSIMHSGGAASISIDELSDDQIERLNKASTSLAIERLEPIAAASPTSSSDEAIVPAPVTVTSRTSQLAKKVESKRSKGILELPSGERIEIPSTETLSKLSDAEYEAGYTLPVEARKEIDKNLDKIEAEYSKNPLYGRWRATDYPFFTVTISSETMRFHKGLTPPFDEWVVGGTYSKASEEELLFRGARGRQETLVRYTGDELVIAEFGNSMLGINASGGKKITPPVKFTFESNRAGEGRTESLLQDLKEKRLTQNKIDFPLSIAAWKSELGRVKIYEKRTSSGYRVAAVDGFGYKSYLEYNFSYPISMMWLQVTGSVNPASRKRERETKLPEGMTLKCKILASNLCGSDPFEIIQSAASRDENEDPKLIVFEEYEQLLEADQLFYGISKLVEWTQVARDNGITDLSREVPIEWPPEWVEWIKSKRKSLPEYFVACEESDDDFHLQIRNYYESENLLSFRESIRWAVLLANLEQFNLEAHQHYESRVREIGGNQNRIETEEEAARRQKGMEKEREDKRLNELFK